jgi:hypothetical protein
MNEQETLFVSTVIETCLDTGIALLLSPDRRVRVPGETSKCSGFFEPKEKLLAVATGREDWIQVLTHEFCHLHQWREHPEEFEGDDRILEVYWDWLERKGKLSQQGIESCTNICRYWELDCEKRVLEMLEKWSGLSSVDQSGYVKRANSYMFFYTLVAETGNWGNETRPYDVQELVSMMPDHFLKLEQYWTVPAEAYKLMKRRCFGEDEGPVPLSFYIAS